MKQLFVAATRQNDGKTMVSLGLFNAIRARFDNVGYIKPVGQQYKVLDGKRIDKDAVLFRSVYDIKDNPQDMSPIAVPRGFTEDYIVNGGKEALEKRLKAAYDSVSKGKDFLVIEGTGHAGVGSVFDFSNAAVAKSLGSKVILVSLGGIGRAIDEIMLNKAVFDLMGVELVGVILNKVKMNKYDKIDSFIKMGLKRQGIDVLGVIPFVEALIKPSVVSIFEGLGGEILFDGDGMHNRVDKCVVGDMVPHDAIDSLFSGSLLILPANREGLVMTALCGTILQGSPQNNLSGIVFTGGRNPHGKVLDLIKKTNTPVLLVQEDSFTVATKINNMLMKVRTDEPEKIEKIQTLVEDYVDVDRICSIL